MGGNIYGDQRSIDRSRIKANFICYPTTFVVSQTVPAGYQALLYGPITIPAGVTLTINGYLIITNPVLSG